MSEETSQPPIEPDVEAAGGDGGEEVQRRRKAARKVNLRVPALNITSFLDMSFCLLTFLILSASFAIGEGALTSNLQALGQGGGPIAPSLGRTIIVESIGDSAILSVQNYSRPIASFADLTKLLREMHDDKTLSVDDDIRIQPSGLARWEHVTSAFNAAVRARCNKVSFDPARN